MLCDICQKREAKIYYTELKNGEKREQYLCEECAAEKTTFQAQNAENSLEGAINGFLSNILGNIYGDAKTNEPKKILPPCPVCKSSYEEVLKTGKFGCASCYDTFKTMVDKSLQQIQGASVHTGKRPAGQKKDEAAEESSVLPISEIDKLSIQLQEAVEREAFEEAAELRDKIRTLRVLQEGEAACLNGTKNKEI